MIKVQLLLLLATIVVAELSDDCQYVNSTLVLSDMEKLRNCFETYTIHQDVIDKIIQNLEIIKDIYVYNDIAQNPPKQPAGYFKAMNFTSALEELKQILAESGGVVSNVFRPVMALINGFRDGHFSLRVKSTLESYEEYDNIFSDVFIMLPFFWDVEVDGNQRNVVLHHPVAAFLPQDVRDLISNFSESGYYAKTINGVDAFTYFANLLGDYRTMKSPQGSLVFNKAYTNPNQGIKLLQFPLVNAFDNQTIVFSDPDSTTINFSFGFVNLRAIHSGTRDIPFSQVPKDPIPYVSFKDEERILGVMRNFKKRTVRMEHTKIPCETSKKMNYMQISSFNYDDEEANDFLQELVECVALFDTNKAPITVILPQNGGGSANLLTTVLFLLMPKYDFRTIDAMRKNDRTSEIAVYIVAGYQLSDNNKTCNSIETYEEFYSYWNRTVVDDLGDGVTHVRSDTAIEGYKDPLEEFMSFRLWRNIRKPTDIIIATDGFCFSSCSNFVDNIIRSGSAIVAGYGVSNPGDELFGAGQCPSGVIDPSGLFRELANNSNYGLNFMCTVLEAFDPTAKGEETIPIDYRILPIDANLQYYDNYDLEHPGDPALLARALAVHEQFQTQCNPKNKRLLFVTDDCPVTKPFAVAGGYACGSNGEWDTSSCKVAWCEDGYIVDYENDQCVPNTCDPRYEPHSSSSSSSSSSSPEPQSLGSSASTLNPVMAILGALLIAVYHILF